ncbi:radical SAM protein [Endomicrobium sp. AH-315-J14]|nr:radical SAM protein [Endomicrobium sp. AH-315-J14]
MVRAIASGMSAMQSSEYPRLVSVETTSHCNAYCVFCPNNALARDKGAMDDDLFEKIIEDCREFPLEAIEPFLQGDPFSDPKIIQRFEHIRRRLPKTKLRVYTNGYGMTPKRIDEMDGLGMDHLYVSLNTLDPDKYEQVMGIPLKRTLKNMAYLTDPMRRGRVAKNITFRMTHLGDTTLKEQDDFIQYCKDSGVRCFIVGLFNYKGDINSGFPVPSYGCEHVHRLDILASGKVTLYCMDQDGEYGWGDARNHSVLELYRHKQARHYRELHTTGKHKKINPYNTCNNFWPNFHNISVIKKVKTNIEYCNYLLQHSPSKRKAPTTNNNTTPNTLIQLQTNHKKTKEALSQN